MVKFLGAGFAVVDLLYVRLWEHCEPLARGEYPLSHPLCPPSQRLKFLRLPRAHVCISVHACAQTRRLTSCRWVQ